MLFYPRGKNKNHRAKKTRGGVSARLCACALHKISQLSIRTRQEKELNYGS